MISLCTLSFRIQFVVYLLKNSPHVASNERGVNNNDERETKPRERRREQMITLSTFFIPVVLCVRVILTRDVKILFQGAIINICKMLFNGNSI